MIEQVKWHGQSIESGMYHMQLIKGGYMSTYFLSKYIKCVLFNIFLVGVWSLIKLGFRMHVEGTWVIICLWVVFNPFFVFTVSYFFTLCYRKRH